MVKTRSQQKIPFPKRKTKSERKSVGKSLDGESKATSCCIASLARVCWEKPKGVENVEKPRPSPAKKSRTEIKASPIVSRQRESEEIQKENLAVPSRRTRRILSYEEDEAKNNIKPGKQAMTNLDMVKSSVKPTNREISDIVVHSSVKGHRDVTRSRVGSSLKDNFKLEHSAKRKLTACRSTGGNLGQGDATLSVFPGGKRSTDNEKDAENNIKPGKQAMTNLDMVKSSAKPTISKRSDIVVHSSVNGHRDVTRSRVGSSLKDNFKLEHSAKRKLPSCGSTGNLGQGDATLSVFPGRKRSTDNEKDAKNNIKPGKQAMTNLDMVKSSAKPTISEISNIVVHSSVKGCHDVTPSRVGSPLKDNLRLECSAKRKLTPCKSSGDLGQGHDTLSVSPGRKRKLTPCKSAGNLGRGHATLSLSSGRKRRHSSTDNEKDETKTPSMSLTVASGHRKGFSDSGSENFTASKQVLCVARQEGKAYKETKHALRSSIPSNLLCREMETKQIETFLKAHLAHRKSGSLYISGAPGTGKTACLTHILENSQKDGVDCHVQFINCMNLSRSHRIYSKIAEELTGWDKLTNNEAQKFLEKKFTAKGTPIVLVLDEIDQLESKNQDVLYTMFEWPSLPSSRLILIGIANALDLTDRVLPRLQLRPECKPKLLHFSPYSKDQIVKILTARLSEVEGSNVVDVSAVQFCARKMAAVSGDMRKALDICRRAVEVVESEVRRQQILKAIDLSGSPKKSGMKKVTIAHVSKVISEVYGSRIVNSTGGEQPTIPLQQKLLICTILLMQKESKLREIPVGQLHETYCSICKKRQVSQISQEDCLSLCNLLETRGIISMKRAKETRMAKVSLKIDEREVDHALQDKILMTSILQGGLSPSRL